MSIIPSKNATTVIEGDSGVNLDNLQVNEVPYKAEDGTLQGSGLMMLSSGALLAPVGFSVESGSVDFGDVIRLSESASFLAIQNMIDNSHYQLVDYSVPRSGPSSKPYIFSLTEAEHTFQATNGSTVLTGPINFEYTTQLTARTNALVFTAQSAMTNVRLRIRDKASNVALKYFPSKSSWLTGKDGFNLASGDNILDFQDTALILTAGTTLVFDIVADNYTIVGNNGVAKFAGIVQQGQYIRIADAGDVASLQTQINNTPSSFSGKYADLTGIPTTFAPSPHTHPISDIVGLSTQISTLNNQIQQANTTLTGLSSVATSGSYADLLNKPSLFSGSYTDLLNKPVLFDGQYSSLSGVPTSFIPSAHTHVISDVTGLQSALDSKMNSGSNIPYSQITGTPALVTKTSQLTNDSGFLTNVTFPVTSVNGKTGSVVLSNTDVGAAATNHTHTISQITNLQSSLDSKITVGATIPYSTITGVPDIPANISFSFKGLNDTDDTAVSNGYLVWNSTGTSISYSTTIPFTALSGKPTTLNGYGITDAVSSSSLSASLANYVTTTGQTSVLANYVTTSTLGNYATLSSLSGYVTSSSLTTTLGNYVTSTNLTSNLGNYVTTSSLTTTLGGYATTTVLTNGLAAKFNTPAGTTTQYVRGDGSLATLPVIPTVVSAFTNDAAYITSSSLPNYRRSDNTAVTAPVKVKYYTATSDATSIWTINLGTDFTEVLDVQVTASSVANTVAGVRQASLNAYSSTSTTLSGITTGNNVLSTVLISAGANTLALVPSTTVRVTVTGK